MKHWIFSKADFQFEHYRTELYSEAQKKEQNDICNYLKTILNIDKLVEFTPYDLKSSFYSLLLEVGG